MVLLGVEWNTGEEEVVIFPVSPGASVTRGGFSIRVNPQHEGQPGGGRYCIE